MREPLTIAVAQPGTLAMDVAANALTHAAAIRAADARVVVFPELSLTGYELDAPDVDLDDERLAPIVAACADTSSTALIGAPVAADGGGSNNALLAVDGSGVTIAYRKVWVDATEEGRFRPGAAPAVLAVDGWRLGMAICKDTGIARHAADTAALGIHAYVAGTLMFDHEIELQDERARRIATEHGIPVAFASFAGPTGGGYVRTAGNSGIWDAEGAVIAQVGPEPGSIARATLV